MPAASSAGASSTTSSPTTSCSPRTAGARKLTGNGSSVDRFLIGNFANAAFPEQSCTSGNEPSQPNFLGVGPDTM
jgi:hypothetical protein